MTELTPPPPPSEPYPGTCGVTTTIAVFDIPPPPSTPYPGGSQSPNAVKQSETVPTDTEEPVAAEVEDEYSHSLSSPHSPPSRRNSESYSRIETLYNQQLEHQNKHKKNNTKKKPIFAPPVSIFGTALYHDDDNNDTNDDEDDEMEQEHFERILQNFTRKESQNNDKRRSHSQNNHNLTARKWLGRVPSPNRATNKMKLSGMNPNRNSIKIGSSSSGKKSPFLTKKGTRSRRADTANLEIPNLNASPSSSHFETMRNWNNDIALPSKGRTHIDKWESHSSDDDDEVAPTLNTVGKANTVSILDSPQRGSMIINSVPPMSLISSVPIDIDAGFEMDPDDIAPPSHRPMHPHHAHSAEFVIKTPTTVHMQLIEGSALRSQTPNSSNIKTFPITRPQNIQTDSVEDDLHNIHADINDVLHAQISDDDDDETELIVPTSPDDDDSKREPIQSEIAFKKTAQELMVSCGNSSDVFAALRSICINLKKDEKLPIEILFSDKILKYQRVDSFLVLLGFSKKTSSWICTLKTRADTKLIDVAVLECHKLVGEARKQSSTLRIIHQKRELTKKRSVSPAPPINNGVLVPLQKPLQILHSQSIEDSVYITSDDEKDDDPDTVHLFELIWGITHHNNEDHGAKDVLLLCYPLVTVAKMLMQCLEARFFRDDHDGRVSTSTSTASNTSGTPSSLYNHASFPSFTDLSVQSLSNHLRSNSNSNELLRKYDRVLSSFSVQAKVIEFMRHWMNRYWDKDWDTNDKLIKYCKLFIKRAKKAYQTDTENLEEHEIKKGLHILSLLEKTMNQQRKKHKMKLNKVLGNENDMISKPRQLTPHGSPRKSGRASSPRKSRRGRFHSRGGSKFSFGSAKDLTPKEPKNICDINCVVIAEQITFMQFKLFQKIHPRECLNQAWKDKERKHIIAPNITQYIDEFNKISKWIQGSILLADEVKSRGRIIKKWVKVSEELYKLRNFQALSAVHSALASNPIFRLKDAWSFVAKKHMVQHKMIKVVMKMDKNFKYLRRLQTETHPPMLPYFGMFAQDLIVIEETTKNRRNDNSINWDALWKLNKAINKHLIYQNTPYNNLEQDATIQRWMNKELDMSGKLDDDWIYLVSSNVVKKDEKQMGKNSVRAKQNGGKTPKARTKSFNWISNR